MPACALESVTFQSTHPVRGATKAIYKSINHRKEFQSTHPVRGATFRGQRKVTVGDFNPRTP